MDYFSFIVGFFSNVFWTVIEFANFTHSCDNRLMPSRNNRSYAPNKPATFTYNLLTLTYRFLSTTFSYHQA